MRNLVPSIIASLLFFTNCTDEFSLIEKDFDITGDWEEVTAVYANICPQKEINYLRINRGFSVDNFFTCNTNPDSIYYDPESIVVTVHKLDDDDTIATYVCRDTLLLKDSSGNFNTEFVHLHYFKSSNLFNGSESNVDFGFSIKTPHKTVYSRTNLLKPIELLSVTPGVTHLGFLSNHFQFRIGFYKGVQVIEAEGFSSFFEKRITGNGFDTVRIEYSFPVGRSYYDNPISYNYGQRTYYVTFGTFFSALERAILVQGDTLNTVERWMDGVYFSAYSGNNDFAIVQSFFNSISTGFTDEFQSYSNINNGVGFLSAYSEVESQKLKYTLKARDTIASRMEDYNFR
jgi:hypothetical protein